MWTGQELYEKAKTMIPGGTHLLSKPPEEVYLTEKLLEIHPWAGGVRYTKAGGESMALAVRIARAFTKKDKILFCG